MNTLLELLIRFAASGLVPASVFFEQPRPDLLQRKTGRLHLQIVSHCWQYTHLLAYQLNSLVAYPPQTLNLTFTVFYAREDEATRQLLEAFSQRSVPGVIWDFQVLETPQLMRRAIGRNKAAKSTQADWIWFTDCDVLFYESALDTLGQVLQGRQDVLVYPQTLLATSLLSDDDPLLSQQEQFKLDRTAFSERHFDRATGPIQIMHADAARQFGYCEQLSVYQEPKQRWVKTYEDRAFRWLLGSQGLPVDVPNLYWIRHQEKGRYRGDDWFSRIRKWIRKQKSAHLNR